MREKLQKFLCGALVITGITAVVMSGMLALKYVAFRAETAEQQAMIDEYEFDLDSSIEALPESAQAAIEGWDVIQVSSRDMKDDLDESGYDMAVLDGRNVIGLTVTKDKIIYLSNDGYYADRALTHEIGHVVDYNNGWISNSEEFLEIYEAEKDSYNSFDPTCDTDSYVVVNTKEFFADVYRQVCIGNDAALQTCPRAAAFVKQFM